ncbi:MFS transporter [Nonomuraea spiralis]|uniref:MFS transporter n=1 Tax=Nonomuraea spiralis TaxID=46182 RepID=A0ABV5I589_9ACTN|nr:MFS transporter [Nonomuraea spiralis]
MAVIEAQRVVTTRRAGPAVAAAGVSSFALLYAPQPVLPQLAADFHLDPGGASLAIGVPTAALAMAVLPLAALAEVAGRRRMIVWSVLVSALIGLALPLAPTFPVLVVMRAAQGVAVAGFAGVGAAYLADLVGASRLAGAVGVMIAGNSVGGMLGRLGAGFAAGPWGWRGGLLVVAGLSLLCSAYAARTLPAAPPVSRTRERARIGTALLAPFAVGALGVGAFVALYNAAGFRLAAPPLSLTPAVASLVFLSYALGTASSAAAGRLADRMGRRAALVTALAVTAAGSLLTVLDPLYAVVLGFAVLTAGFFAAHAVANAWVAAQAPPAARGRAAGIYTLCYYLGSGAGGTAGSAVYGHAGWSWLIVATSAGLLLAIVTVLVAGPRRRAVARAPRREYA